MTYEERIERAGTALCKFRGYDPDEAQASAERAVAAFLGSDEVFIICPDCNGNGAIWTMAPNPGLDETVQDCVRCRQWQGMVPLKEEQP